MKTSEELEISHPALAEELTLITTEVRAGKPRIEAFKNFAARTTRGRRASLVAMLVQTDRFGTSVAQALRTHAETSRTKRRQRAEEKAAKIGVKLVFPLVFFLFPAFYVVTLGPGGHPVRPGLLRTGRSSVSSRQHQTKEESKWHRSIRLVIIARGVFLVAVSDAPPRRGCGRKTN